MFTMLHLFYILMLCCFVSVKAFTVLGNCGKKTCPVLICTVDCLDGFVVDSKGCRSCKCKTEKVISNLGSGVSNIAKSGADVTISSNGPDSRVCSPALCTLCKDPVERVPFEDSCAQCICSEKKPSKASKANPERIVGHTAS